MANSCSGTVLVLQIIRICELSALDKLLVSMFLHYCSSKISLLKFLPYDYKIFNVTFLNMHSNFVL